MRRELFLGIDAGSVSLNLAVVDGARLPLYTSYTRVKGRLCACIQHALAELAAAGFHQFDAAQVTGSGRDLIGHILDIPRENEISTHACATVLLHPGVRTVIEIGGEDAKLILLDAHGAIVDHVMNEICAAGTGAFLDHQAERLGISIEQFGQLALRSEHPARIATRCAVFAKTDMIHLQQQGLRQEDIVAGFCHALASTFRNSMIRGRPLHEPISFQGGVASNPAVVRAFEQLLGVSLLVPEHHEVMGAIGAALIARGEGAPVTVEQLDRRLQEHVDPPVRRNLHLPPLARRVSSRHLESGTTVSGPTYVGIDVGSVATKAVLVDPQFRVLAGRIVPTRANPQAAVDDVLRSLEEEAGPDADVVQVGVTGSARHLAGALVRADTLVDEVTAQAAAASLVAPDADAVVEIGGNDAKYIRLQDGRVLDFEMNKTCAAGTGSFLEEQARRLSLDVPSLGEAALRSRRPVDLGSRCAVFMNSELNHFQQQGAPVDDLAAGLIYAVVRNYLQRVVAGRPIGRKVLFQGGVARSASVVSAMEHLIGRAVTVPPHPELTGAIGAARLAALRATQATQFRGFSPNGRALDVTTFRCDGCPNHCDIEKVHVGGQLVSAQGSVCGRHEPNLLPNEAFDRRQQLLHSFIREDGSGEPIGLPRALSFYDSAPFWVTFLQELGFRVVVSGQTTRRLVEQGTSVCLAETCLPAKFIYGHAMDLAARGVKRILIPVVNEVADNDGAKSYNCTYIQNASNFVTAALGLELLSPEIKRRGRRIDYRRPLEALAVQLGRSPRDARRALRAAWQAQSQFRRQCQQIGRDLLAQLGEDELALVVIGRPYCLHDPVASLNIGRRLQAMGLKTVPMDVLPVPDGALPHQWQDVVWYAGQACVRAARYVGAHPQLQAVYVCNFGCGPDSFLRQQVREVLAGKPVLEIELAEHVSHTGLVTRCEAFLQMIRADRLPRRTHPKTPHPTFVARRKYRHLDKTFYVPHLADNYMAICGALRHNNCRAEMLPRPDQAILDFGRRYASDDECLSHLIQLGTIMVMLTQGRADPRRSVFWVPGNNESCKISGFGSAIAVALERLGYSRELVFNPRFSPDRDEATQIFGLTFAKNSYEGWLAIDLLHKAQLEMRPDEINPGETDATHQRCLQRVFSRIGKWDFMHVVREAADAMRRIPTHTPRDRAIVGIIGEDISLENDFINHGLVRRIEALGARVFLQSHQADYFDHQGQRRTQIFAERHLYLRSVGAMIRETWRSTTRNIMRAMFDFLRNRDELSPQAVMAASRPYMPLALDITPLRRVSKAVDFIRKGAAGIIHVFPLNCMYSTAVEPSYHRLRQHTDIPILTLQYDGQEETNQRTRLEAFMQQVHQVARRGPACAPSLE